MIHWYWLIPAFISGAITIVILIAWVISKASEPFGEFSDEDAKEKRLRYTYGSYNKKAT